MEKTDTRKLKPEVLQQLRHQAIRLRKKGMTYKAISEVIDVHYTTICGWWKVYEKEGAKGIRLKIRGRKDGDKRTLNPEQEKELQKIIEDKEPDQLKLPFALWTRRAVLQIIKNLYRIDMPVRTVGEYLKRWGFTPQKPLKRAYEQNPEAVKKWMTETYPEITEKAKKERAEIHWGDETGLCSDTQHGRSYAPRGGTPVIRLCAKKNRINLISSITNQGKVRFMVYHDTMNSQTLIKFLKRLIKDTDQKVFLILDNLRVHHSKLVKEWLARHREEIELFHLPSYSPELNPDEYLNCDLKAGVHSGVPARSTSDLKKKAISHLRMLQKKPGRVTKYFKHPRIRYAA
jgi:transposase